jgi:hypothetical protein
MLDGFAHTFMDAGAALKKKTGPHRGPVFFFETNLY